MKKFRAMHYLKRIALMVFIVTAFVSCSNDDDFLEKNAINQNSGNSSDGSSAGQVTGNQTNNPIGNDGEITLYKVSGDVITKIQDYQVSGQNLAFQQDIARHNEIWELVKKIVPISYRTKMSEFLIYSGSANQTAGFVVQTKQDLSEWKMGIAIDYSYQGSFNEGGELAYTVIHEFGHMLTLNNSQLDSSISEASCTNYFPGEGCAKEAAYINKLQRSFWADIWSQYQQTQVSQSAMQGFYTTYNSRFVTQYASTNPGEDIAEVFAIFVTRAGGVNGSSKAEQKIQLMYDHPELVALRNYIRGNISSRSLKGSFVLPAPGSWKQANRIGNPYKKRI